MISNLKRGVGYCQDTDCVDYAKGVFLINPDPVFACPRCKQEGHIERERGKHEGTSDLFKEVRVEFDFDPINFKYRYIAIVRDESIIGQKNAYTLLTPMIKTEKRALKVAESILANLAGCTRMLHEGEIPKTTELILSFDDDLSIFKRKLATVADGWEKGSLSK